MCSRARFAFSQSAVDLQNYVPHTPREVRSLRSSMPSGSSVREKAICIWPLRTDRSFWNSATGPCYQPLLREEQFLFPASMIPHPQSLSAPCLLDHDGPITHPLCLRQYERQRSELHPSMKSQTPSQAEVIHFGCLKVSIRLSRADARI
jgi:hypothetical protein